MVWCPDPSIYNNGMVAVSINEAFSGVQIFGQLELEYILQLAMQRKRMASDKKDRIYIAIDLKSYYASFLQLSFSDISTYFLILTPVYNN